MRLLAGVVAPPVADHRSGPGTLTPPAGRAAARNGRWRTRTTEWGGGPVPGPATRSAGATAGRGVATRSGQRVRASRPGGAGAAVGRGEPVEAALERRLHSGYVDAFAGDVVVLEADAAPEVTREMAALLAVDPANCPSGASA